MQNDQNNLPDHLGSVKAVVNQNGTVDQATDYYPYGLAYNYNNLDKNRYLYNGKELQNQTLSTTFFGVYDYGARYYDPEIGRWNTGDPLAHEFPGWSPYSTFFCNPIYWVDPTGMAPDNYYYDKKGNQTDYVKTDQPDKFFVQDDKGTVEYKDQKFSKVNLNSELGHLSRIIYAEAGGENQTSKEAVGDVMKNRVESPKFPDTYQGVAEQKITTKKGVDIYQFSSVNPKDASNWRYSNPLSAKIQEERTAFANSVATGIKVFNNGSGITGGALLYYSPKSMVPKLSVPNWNFNLLKETTPVGISSENFKFYKYK